MTHDPARDHATGESLDSRIRRVDPDRWLASRFIGNAEARGTIVAVYALNDELARIGGSVSQALAGEIRLAWWRERIEAIAAGEPVPPHPALKGVAPAIVAGRLGADLLDTLVEARHADLEPAPFGDDAALARYLDGTAGAVMGLAVRVLAEEAPLRAVVEAGRAWGLAGLYRARGDWRAQGRSWVPASWGAPDEAALQARVRSEVAAAIVKAREAVAALPIAAFPAVAYATLAIPYARDQVPGEMRRRLALLKSVLTGRL